MSDSALSSRASGEVQAYRFTYPDLPVSARREEITAALHKHRVLVIEGGTGSGKSTQLPKILLEAGLLRGGLLGVTQPRRLATLALADRLREETGSAPLIGSQIRFHEDMPEGARIKVMTDGVLLQEYRRDPLLRRYDALIIDEAHERSLNIDILLGVGRMLAMKRPDLKLVIASATLDAERFQHFYDGVPGGAGLLRVEGRQYPVTIEYRDPGGDELELSPVEAAAQAIRDLMFGKPDDLLCFLPTEKEINELARELEKDLGERCVILPLYGRLAPGDQKRVYQRHHRPKVVLATNIAETSLTLPGIAYVVDTGTARISRYHPQTRIQGLPIEKIAQASAAQRAGRAGRVKPGLCVRLYSREDLESRPQWPEPEILRGNLTNAVLQLLALRLPVLDFPFLDAPAPAALKGAYRRLQELGAVTGDEEEMQLTDEGWRMSRLPVDAAIAKILLTAQAYQTLPSAMVVAAGLTIQDPRITPTDEPERGRAVGLHRRFEDPRSDFLTLIRLWAFLQREWRDGFSQRRLRRLCEENYLSYLRIREWSDLVDQFRRILMRRDPAAPATSVSAAESAQDIDPAKLDTDALHKAILSGFLAHLARRRRDEPSYRLVGDKEAFIHSGSSLAKRRPEWIVAGEVRQTSRTFIQRACEIQPAWVEEVAPDAVKRSYGDIAWNAERGFVEAVERVTYRNFTLRQDRRVDYAKVDPEACADLFWQEAVLRNQNAGPFPFLAHNQGVLAALAGHEAKMRRRDLTPGDDALLAWYRERAPGVHSRVTLRRFLDDKASANELRLHLHPKDFEPAEAREEWQALLAILAPEASSRAGAETHPLEGLFPDTLEGNCRVAYRFDFGQELDGLSIEAPLHMAATLTPRQLWSALPGWRLWILSATLEKLTVRDQQRVLERREALLKAWSSLHDSAAEPSLMTPALALGEAMTSTFSATWPEIAQALPAWPTLWPPHLRLKLFFTAANGRRLLVSVDPGTSLSEWALGLAEQLYGKEYASLPYGETAAKARLAWGEMPPSLVQAGLRLAPMPWAPPRAAGHLGVTGKPGVTGGAAANAPSATPPGYFWRRDGLDAAWAEALAARSPQGGAPALAVWDRQGRLGDFLLRRFEALAAALRVPHDVLAASKTWLEQLAKETLPHALAARGTCEDQVAEWDKRWRPAKVNFKTGASAKSFKDLNPLQPAQGGAPATTAWALLLGAASLTPEALLAAVAQIENTLLALPGSDAHREGLPTTPAWRRATGELQKAWHHRMPQDIFASRTACMTAAALALGIDAEALPWPERQLTWESWSQQFAPLASGDSRHIQTRQALKAQVEAWRQNLKSLGLLPQHWPKGLAEALDALAAGSENASGVLGLFAFAAREALKRQGKKNLGPNSVQAEARQAVAVHDLRARFKKL